MSEKVIDYQYLSVKPGVQLIKKGTYPMVELDQKLGIPGLKSQIIDVPVTDKKDAYQLGYFAMQPGEGFEFTYTYLEIKVVVSGSITVHDDQGVKYTAEVGDVFIFTPDTTVYFDGESDGSAVYTGHRMPEPDFM
ncbi:DUF861 domain-containing protein [Gracilibacillus oryzae]|uniref:DUF861 domain-containing protein n=1 Tax=Gracilibacillus oryzae TaxID=1672701 RepID=A0A7C8KQK6_9BACI|nr:cupin domain-containing protein [Gracilibacillus oryzae]KAB8137458.1 DUF861 domain-containing protein [Gracilibacillus oryzae]